MNSMKKLTLAALLTVTLALAGRAEDEAGGDGGANNTTGGDQGGLGGDQLGTLAPSATDDSAPRHDAAANADA